MSGAAARVAEGGWSGRIFGRRLMRAALAAVVLAFALPTAGFAAIGSAAIGSSAINLPKSVAPGEKMLVESDQLVYDYDNNAVSAVGNVKIYYAGYTLEAEKVTYNKTSGRLFAFGRVKLVDPTGSAYYSDYLDITDDFRDGFVQSLRVDSADHTHFGAASAQQEGDQTTFTEGSYTACEPCKENPDKPPLWDVKATKIVFNHKEHMVYFTNARLEFMGVPLAWSPYFAVPDPSVKRKSGILAPSIGYSEKLGFFGTVPYYWVIAPNMDVTFSPTYLSRQGFLGAIEFRHRLSNGQYTLNVSGIHQSDPEAWRKDSPSRQTWRGAVRTSGSLDVADDWTFGWNGTLMSDSTFIKDYGAIDGVVGSATSTTYLTGLKDRNYFSARASYYKILVDPTAIAKSERARYHQDRQAIVVPEIDYKKYADGPVFGGELSSTANLTTLTRGEDDSWQYAGSNGPTYFAGTAGTFVRATEQIDWRRRFIGPMGQVITPFAYVRGDAFYLQGQTAAAVAAGITSDADAYRFMPAVGLDWRLPILVQTDHSTNIIEPRVQLIVRPNEMMAGKLPNNDAQSLVFGVSNLFDLDKFSGYDREEGGTRLNAGLHYNGTFDNGASVDATFGQSFHLAGTNPYATSDVSGLGGSGLTGLESDHSDYVAGAALDSGLGPRISANGRFDNSDFAINRGEVEATSAFGPLSASAAYLYLRHNPYNENLESASILRGASSLNISDNWRVFGTLIYDVKNTTLASKSLGIAFDNECLTVAVAYSENRAGYTDVTPSRWLTFRLQMRTLGNSVIQNNLGNLTN